MQRKVYTFEYKIWLDYTDAGDSRMFYDGVYQ